MRMNYEKKIMTKTEGNKKCNWKTEVIDLVMNTYWDLKF